MNDSELSAAEAVRPVIGITSYLEQAQTGVWDVRASFLPEVYIRAVTDAGGTVGRIQQSIESLMGNGSPGPGETNEAGGGQP